MWPRPSKTTMTGTVFDMCLHGNRIQRKWLKKKQKHKGNGKGWQRMNPWKADKVPSCRSFSCCCQSLWTLRNQTSFFFFFFFKYTNIFFAALPRRFGNDKQLCIYCFPLSIDESNTSLLPPPPLWARLFTA